MANYYTTTRIDKENALYNLIFGDRSTGKTTACLTNILKAYAAEGSQGAIIRRWADDFKSKRGAVLFDSIVERGVVHDLFEGVWDNVYYYNGRWYLCTYEDGKRILADEPFAFAFALTQMEHDKSSSYPKVKTIVFDEFITRHQYLPNEFILFQNTLSTIIRDRDDVKIYMLGNSVNKYGCPYFKEMGLTHITEMKAGDIALYRYGDSELTVAVEFTGSANDEYIDSSGRMRKGKPSDKFFAFNNEQLKMITKPGEWEMDIYPHLTIKFKPKDIRYTFFIQYDGNLAQCEVVKAEGQMFIYIHRKTTELKNPDKDLIYSDQWDMRPNWRRRITKPTNERERLIMSFFVNEKIVYQDNDMGELIRQYLLWCSK